jgi:hypothetical protein
VLLPKNNGPLAGRLRRGLVMLAVLALPAAPAVTLGQRVVGPWEDATIAPRRILRVGVAPTFGQWKERHDASGRRGSLGGPLTVDSLGAALIPFIGLLEPAMVTLTGLAAPPLSLGSLKTNLDVTEVTTGISLEYGVTSRLGLQVLVPYVKNRVYVMAAPNQGGAGPTLGFNPGSALAGARQQNDAVIASLTTAASTLTSELARCMNLNEPACGAINADRAGAAALVQQATNVSDAIAAVFGTSTVAGSPFAPVVGGALFSALDARLAALSTGFTGFLGSGTTGEWIGTRPVPAAPMAAADLNALLGDARYGFGARPLGDYEHSNVGDIEVGAKFLLLDTFGPPSTAPLPSRGAMRLAVTGVYRLPTAQRDLVNDFTDLATGDRQADIEVRGHADLALGSRVWASAVARYALQQPDRFTTRIGAVPGNPLAEVAREQDVDRNLGDVMELEIAPRYVPNDELAFSAMFRYRTKGADTYRGTFNVTSADGTPLSLDAALLGIGTEATQQVAGFAATYSTVRANANGRARWPLEISYVHTQVLGGENVPRVQSHAIVLRVYRR